MPFFSTFQNILKIKTGVYITFGLGVGYFLPQLDLNPCIIGDEIGAEAQPQQGQVVRNLQGETTLDFISYHIGLHFSFSMSV